MTTPPPTADGGSLPDAGWLPDEATLNRWAGEFWSALPDDGPQSLPVGPTEPAGHAPAGVPAPSAVTPGDPTPLDPILAWALAPFLTVPGGGAPLDSVAPPVDVPGSAVSSWLASPVSATPSFGFLDGLRRLRGERPDRRRPHCGQGPTLADRL